MQQEESSGKKKVIIFLTILTVAAVAALFFLNIWRTGLLIRYLPPQDQTGTSSPTSASAEDSASANSQGVSEEGNTAPRRGEVSIETPGIEYDFAEPSESNIRAAGLDKGPIPDLSRAIPDGLSAAGRAEMENIISLLRKDQNNAVLWSELGLYRKEIGDYDGTRAAWEFALKLQPENAVISENLGVLYGYYLKNPVKSEEFFRAAVALEPRNINLRLRLFELYRDVFRDKGKARAAIEAALKDNPDNQQMAALLSEL